MADTYQDRISYRGPLPALGSIICSEYNLGKLVHCEPIPIGYEDFNVKLTTAKGSYLAKIFSDSRDATACETYATVMSLVERAGVHTPRMYRTEQGILHQFNMEGSPIRMALMDFVFGDTYYQAKEFATADDARVLGRQAALIGTVRADIEPTYDSWAIVNFKREAAKKMGYLQLADRQAVEYTLSAFDAIDIESLPTSFIHGDIISTNVIRDPANALWLLDFSVAGTYPRVQEIAVLASDLLFDPRSPRNSANLIEQALIEIERESPLNPHEKHALPTYILAAHAVHILNAGYEKYMNGNTSSENEYFLERGRQGLRQAAAIYGK